MEFEQRGEGTPVLLHITQPGRPVQTYESYERYRTTQEELKDYTGTYRSDELDANFELSIERNRLTFTHRNAPSGALVPLTKDIFTIGNMRIMFSRNDEGTITSFLINAGRVQNLRFRKD